MTQRVFAVTGASTGIGRELAIALASQGHAVVMVSRDPARAAAALEQLKRHGKNVSSLVGDLSLVSEARRLARELSALPRLDALIHCAALVPSERKLTSEGLETAFAANLLAPFVLTTALEPLLKQSAPSRVVFFYGGNGKGFDFENLQNELGLSGWLAYGQTKIGCALLTGEFARRLAGTKVTVNAAWPGIVNTEGMRAMPGAMGVMTFLMRPMMRTPVQGAQTPLWVATAPELSTTTGKAFGTMFGDGKKELPLPPFATDPAAAARLYSVCEQLAAAR